MLEFDFNSSPVQTRPEPESPQSLPQQFVVWALLGLVGFLVCGKKKNSCMVSGGGGQWNEGMRMERRSPVICEVIQHSTFATFT